MESEIKISVSPISQCAICGVFHSLDDNHDCNPTTTGEQQSTTQDEALAREAWKEITDLADNMEDAIGDLQGDSNFIRIILAAITKSKAQREKADPIAVQLLQYNDKEIQQLRSQLAAAQATIVDFNENGYPAHMEKIKLDNTDCLDDYVREKLNPLIDALTQSREAHEKMNPRLPRRVLIELSNEYHEIVEVALVNARKLSKIQ